MPTYDADLFDPAAPVADVTVRNTVTGVSARGRMLIDTGADVTLLPETLADSLGLVQDATHAYELVGFDDSRSVSPSVAAELILVGKAFRRRYLLTHSDHGVLGCNVLNHLVLLLDGPRREWREEPGR